MGSTARSVCLVALALLLPAMCQAQHDGFGLGLIVGEPTGVSLKQWTGPRTAFAFGFAWSFADDAALHIHADYLLHSTQYSSELNGRSPFYYGLGVRLKAEEDDTWLGVRVPLGVAFFINDEPIDFFMEVAPLMDLVPETEFRLNAALGARYYF
jgi:hypothetical protein